MVLAPRRAAVAVLALAVGLLTFATPREASADAAQFCRANMNIVLAPFDIALAPFISAKDMYYGITEVDDEILIKIFAAAPGYVYLTFVQMGGGVIRLIAGLFEIPGGLVALWTGNASGALFRSQDESWNMYNADWGPCPVRFGVSYNTINEG